MVNISEVEVRVGYLSVETYQGCGRTVLFAVVGTSSKSYLFCAIYLLIARYS